MQFYLHADYVKAAAPRSSASIRDVIEARRAKAPPSQMRAYVARVLAGAAHRVDRESARRALA
ncbi:hypothetical protein DSM104299_01436 [Baekduia alba]|uniref:hypothetical protein n=1 Tax=Baekduia alba TaxID=2997333 RepID=UPI002341D6C3|nr:hypothetical protein [Baekduia alba]WCB92737.1 hypothetical protein DSM104299_01436 [Baekduia alba]